MNLLLLGRTGQVGGDLWPLLAKFGRVHVPDRHTVDLSRPDSIRECVRALRPQFIFNAAAYTAVDKAESEHDAAAALNTTAPSILAQEAAKLNAWLIHYSTDYVFDGSKPDPYVEDDPVSPLNVYGRTKAAGEDAIRQSGCRHLILRASWVFSDRGSNFLLTMLRLGSEREELRIVDDQVGAPTSSKLIARATVHALERLFEFSDQGANTVSGTYHLTAGGYTSWYGFAEEIFQRLRGEFPMTIKKIIPISSKDYATPAKRPLNSRLDCSKFGLIFGIKPEEWRDGLLPVLDLLKTRRPTSAH